MGDISPERKSGCGLITSVFGRHGIWSRKSSSAGSSPIAIPNNSNDPKRRRSGSKDVVYVDAPSHNVSNSSNNNNPQRRHPNVTTMTRDTLPKVSISATTQGYVNQGRRVPKEAIGISGELESMINDHHKTKGNSTLVRASSSNVMLFGNLGNLRQGADNNNNNNNSYSRTAMDNNFNHNVAKSTINFNEQSNGSLCRALSTRMDPEQLKIMGNEDYKNGRFAEALALYDAAIAIDPKKASYRSNRSAALTALGRLLEAVFECREAIRIEPHYHRAHLRLGNLHFRYYAVFNTFFNLLFLLIIILFFFLFVITD